MLPMNTWTKVAAQTTAIPSMISAWRTAIFLLGAITTVKWQYE